MLSTSAKVLQWCRHAGIKSTQVPHTHSVSQQLPSYVYLWRKGHPKTGEIQVHTHGVDISLLLCSQLPPKSCNHRAMPESSSHRYPTHILSHNHCHHMCIREAIGTRKPLKLTFIHTCWHFSVFMLSTSAKVLQWWRYAGIKSTQVPHTYSVSQPLSSHVYSWSNRHPQIVQIHVHTHGVDISLLLCSQLPPKSLNDGDMPESSPHRYPTHIVSHNH